MLNRLLKNRRTNTPGMYPKVIFWEDIKNLLFSEIWWTIIKWNMMREPSRSSLMEESNLIWMVLIIVSQRTNKKKSGLNMEAIETSNNITQVDYKLVIQTYKHLTATHLIQTTSLNLWNNSTILSSKMKLKEIILNLRFSPLIVRAVIPK